MTVSIRYFVDAGSTNPATRLIAIRRRPNRRSQRRGRTSFHTSGSTFLRSVFFFCVSPAPARIALRVPALRSALIDVMDPGRIISALSSRPTCCNKRAHAKYNEHQHQRCHRCLLFHRDRMGKLFASKHLNVIVDALRRPEKPQQPERNRNMHEEHALLRIIRNRQKTKNPKQQAKNCRNKRSWSVTACRDKPKDTKKNQNNAKADRSFCHACERASAASSIEHWRNSILYSECSRQAQDSICLRGWRDSQSLQNFARRDLRRLLGRN